MIKIQVLLSTYNGDKYLREQINSLLSQEEVEIDILVRDDGSTDKTIEILKEFKDRGELNWFSGDNIGVKKSFLELVKQSSRDFDYYAFCDQDDVWLNNKLYEAGRKLNSESHLPLLYFSKTTKVDQDLSSMEDNDYKGYSYSFSEVLVKNNATGCTMIFNSKLKEIINEVDYNELNNKPLHDHWIYMLCLAVGGKIVYDNESYIMYRQHKNNVVGGSRTIRQKIKDHSLLSKESLKQAWAIEILNKYGDFLDEKNIEILNVIASYKENYLAKIKLIKNILRLRFNIAEKILLIMSIIINRY